MNMNFTPSDSDLFETPPGVRVIPAESLLADPDRTVAMDFGDIEESEDLLRGFDPEAMVRNTRTAEMAAMRLADRLGDGAAGRLPVWGPTRPITRQSTMRTVLGFGPGTRFVAGLLLLTASLGAMGLALSWQSRDALVVGGFFAAANGVLLWVFWRSWLDGLPYVYRLLSSLGEDAENLRNWRLTRALGGSVRSLYR